MNGVTSQYENIPVLTDMESNLRLLKQIFKKDAVLRTRTVELKGSGTKCAVLYMDGMADSEIVNDSIIRPLVTVNAVCKGDICDFIYEKVLFASELKKQTDISECIREMLYGDTLLFIDKSPYALTINTKGFETRSITEPTDERVLQGPREGFCETALFNLAMIRRKLLTPDLCIEMLRLGRRTDTMVYICYLDTLADKNCVEELKKRLNKIDIDGILDTNYIDENIRDHRFSLFKTTGTTERPDIVAARLLEGRIAVVTDGTPIVLTLPYLFSENFQSDEDYYVNFTVAFIGRILRYFCFWATVSIPAIFVALTTFHKQLLPTSFALSVAQLRGGVPLYSFAECLILILVFEILTEAELRMPQSLGHALSIVGGLVVGDAAVQAKIISAPMLIAVAISGISGLMVPRLKGVIFYMRLMFAVSAAFCGFYGYIILSSIFLIMIFNMKSFGVDYTEALQNPNFQNLKDTVIRAPWYYMKTRPPFNKDKIRLSSKG
ncbi:MAG: spore germination protein [Clostridia bacterium]|nr:spore germination protein [Clostridia bacterium]